MQQYQLFLISHQVENDLIHQRAIDGYINATAICKAADKKINGYVRLKTTQEFLAELSSETRIPVSELLQIIQSRKTALRGTWAHPDVVINLGQWCSPKFAVAVSKWVREWVTGKLKPANIPYHVKKYIANRSEIPVTHFSILNEMIYALIAPLESVGYTIPDDMVPDISAGRMFCKWLREEKNIDTDSLPTYRHIYEDGRIVYPKLYPNEVLADFRKYFYEKWLPKKAENYFLERDSKGLPSLQKLLSDTRKKPYKKQLKYKVTQIGKWKLNEPVFMTMHTIKKSKSSFCYECGDKIRIGETYYYHDELYCYCITCIGVEGDPDDLLSFEIPEYKYEGDVEKEIDFE